MNQNNSIISKIIDISNLTARLENWKTSKKNIVFTNGCFDIIHRGHVDYLSKAANLGDILIVGLNTDASVQRIKGTNRPIQDEYSRAMIMASFFFVDLVVFFDDDTPYELIKKVQPDILVKGSDYKAENIVGYDILMAKNGKVKTLDFVEGFSTSKIINKILSE